MSTVVAPQGSVSAAATAERISLDRRALIAVAGAGLLVAAGGCLLVATSDQLVDPVAFATSWR